MFRIDERTYDRWLKRGWLREAGWVPSAPPDRKSCVQLLEVVEPYLALRMSERLATDPELAASLFVLTLPASQRWNLVKHSAIGAHVRSRRHPPKASRSRATSQRGAAKLRFALKRRFPATAPFELEQLSEVAQASDDARVAEALWTEDLVDSVRAVAISLADAAAGQGVSEASNESPDLEAKNDEAKIMEMEEDLLFMDEEVLPAGSEAHEFGVLRPVKAEPNPRERVPVPSPTSHALTSAEFTALCQPAATAAATDPDSGESDAVPDRPTPPTTASAQAEPEVAFLRPEPAPHDLDRWELLERQLERISSALERASENFERHHGVPPEAPATTTQDISALRDSLAPLVDKLGEHTALQQRGTHEITSAIGKLKSDLESLPMQIAATVPAGLTGPSILAPSRGESEPGRSRLMDPGSQLACVSLLATAWAIVFWLRLASPPLAAVSLVLAITAASFAIAKWGTEPTNAG